MKLTNDFHYNKDHYIENVYKLSQARYGQKYKHVCQIYSKNEIDSWLNENGGTIIDQEFYKIFTGEFWTFGDRIYPPLNVGPNDKCHLACFLIQKKKEGDI